MQQEETYKYTARLKYATFTRAMFKKSVNCVLCDLIWYDVISGYFSWQALQTVPRRLLRALGGGGVGLSCTAALYLLFTILQTQWNTIISLRLCYFRRLFSVTAAKSLTMKARAAAVCDPLCCTWQPRSEAGQAKKCCWVVGRGFGVTAYLRDLLWCHLGGFKTESLIA